jgi:uncharacterized coiled-coil DUF342 family protein
MNQNNEIVISAGQEGGDNSLTGIHDEMSRWSNLSNNDANRENIEGSTTFVTVPNTRKRVQIQESDSVNEAVNSFEQIVEEERAKVNALIDQLNTLVTNARKEMEDLTSQQRTSVDGGIAEINSLTSQVNALIKKVEEDTNLLTSKLETSFTLGLGEVGAIVQLSKTAVSAATEINYALTQVRREAAQVTNDSTQVGEKAAQVTAAAAEIKDALTQVREEAAQVTNDSTQVREETAQATAAAAKIKDALTQVREETAQATDAVAEIKQLEAEAKIVVANIKRLENQIEQNNQQNSNAASSSAFLNSLLGARVNVANNSLPGAYEGVRTDAQNPIALKFASVDRPQVQSQSSNRNVSPRGPSLLPVFPIQTDNSNQGQGSSRNVSPRGPLLPVFPIQPDNSNQSQGSSKNVSSTEPPLRPVFPIRPDNSNQSQGSNANVSSTESPLRSVFPIRPDNSNQSQGSNVNVSTGEPPLRAVFPIRPDNSNQSASGKTYAIQNEEPKLKIVESYQYAGNVRNNKYDDDDDDDDGGGGYAPIEIITMDDHTLSPHMRFIKLAMGVNGYDLKDAFSSQTNGVPTKLKRSTRWNDFLPYLKMEIVTAASVLHNCADTYKPNITMDDIVMYLCESGSTLLGRILASISVTNKLRNPTKNNVIMINWLTCVELTMFKEQTLKLKRFHRNEKLILSPIEKYVEFLRIAAGMSGRTQEEMFPGITFTEIEPDWIKLRMILSAEIDSAMVHVMRYVRKFKANITENEIIMNDVTRAPCARLAGRFIVNFESENVSGGTSKLQTFVQSRALHAAMSDVVNSMKRALLV